MARIAIFLCVFAVSATSPNEGIAPIARITSPVASDGVVRKRVGQTLTLSCETANSSDSIAWYFNNEPITSGSSERGRHTLSQLHLGNGGWYTCAAANSFGRDEKDFLLVVGEPPSKEITFRYDVYRAPVGSRVELPCHFRGTPQPTIQWFEANNEEISVTDSRYLIDNVTKSLVISGPASGERRELSFSCLAQNVFDIVRSSVSVVFFTFIGSQVPFSFPLNNRKGPIVLSSQPYPLRCTNITFLAANNYTVNWTRNFMVIPGRYSNELNINQSGYYCCNVSNPGTIPTSHFCITVVNRSSSVPKVNVSTTSVSLPSNRNRTANLLCSGSTLSGYAPPIIEWLASNESQLTSNEGVSNISHGFQYVTRTQSGTECMEETCSAQYTCFGNNFFGSSSATVEIKTVALDTCTSNSLKGGNAELSNAEMGNYWLTTGVGASFETIFGENVFVLQYNDSANLPKFHYTISLTQPVIHAQLSGRIRQDGPGEALIELLVDGKKKCPGLVNPYPTHPSWQWVGCRLNTRVTGANMTVVMTVRTTDSQSSVDGVAYFDDLYLCLTFDENQTDSGGLTEMVYIIIGAGAACGALLVFVVVIICCCVCRYCCCGKRKGNIRMMKRMSTLIKTRQSKVNEELKGVVERYHSSNPVAQSKSESVKSDTYVVAAPQSKTDTIASASYSYPDNRTYSAGQPVTVVPPVVVKRPNHSSVSAASPASASTGVGATSNQSNGEYTSLKRGEIEMDNLYTTPVFNAQNHTDSESDHEEEEYVNVEDGPSAGYLQVISSTSPDDKRSFSGGRRSPSPKLPVLPPPLPTATQIYENSQQVVSSGSSMANRAFSYTSTGIMTLPAKVQSLPESQRIYENTSQQDLAPSLSPVSNGAFRRTFSDLTRSPSPRSPPISMSVEPDNRIYENNQEVMLLEDTGDDIYENDLPGMNQQAPGDS